ELRPLRDVLEARLARAATPAERSLLVRRLAETAEGLGELARAADLWAAALADPAQPPEERRRWRPRAVDALRAAARLDAWPALAEEELAEGAPAPARRRALRRALVEAWRALGDGARALAHARALVDDPDGGADAADRRRLVELLAAEGEGVERARRLAALLADDPDGPHAYTDWCTL